jgi:hypothetical protein
LNSPKIAYPPAHESLELNANQPIEAPSTFKVLPTSKSSARAIISSDHQPQHQNVLSSAREVTAGSNPASITSRLESSERNEERPQSFRPFKPRINLMDPKPPRLSFGFVGGQISPDNSDSDQGADTQHDKSVLSNARDSILKAVGRVPLVGPRLIPNPESERKATAAHETADATSPNPLVTKINGKIFHLEKGVLIDQEYKPEMEKWARWLRPDSKEYKEILEKDPSLTVFFERGPILIVWKNGIYKVLK